MSAFWAVTSTTSVSPSQWPTLQPIQLSAGAGPGILHVHEPHGVGELVRQHDLVGALHDLERVRHVRRTRHARHVALGSRDRPSNAARGSSCAARPPPADTESGRQPRRLGPAESRAARRVRAPGRLRPRALRDPSWPCSAACHMPLRFGFLALDCANVGAVSNAAMQTAIHDDDSRDTKLSPVMARPTAEAPSRRGTACCRSAA